MKGQKQRQGSVQLRFRRAVACATLGTAMAVALGVLPVTTAVAGAGKTKHALKYSYTIGVLALSRTGNPAGPPRPGDRLLEAGTVSGKPGGSGAIVTHIKITGLDPATGAGAYTGTFTVFLANGTQSGTIAGTARPQPDHSVRFSATGTYTCGTGAYKGIKGHATATGSNAGTPGAPDMITVTGTATY